MLKLILVKYVAKGPASSSGIWFIFVLDFLTGFNPSVLEITVITVKIER